MSQASEADVTPLRNFLFSNPEKPLVTTGSGGAESVADFAALLYGARGGVGTAVSPPILSTPTVMLPSRLRSCFWSAPEATTTTSLSQRNEPSM